MLDFGWSEFFLIVILAIVLMGPKDIPEVIHGFGRLVRRVQYLKFALSKQFDDFMEKADLQDLRRGTLGDIDPKNVMTPLPLQKPVDQIAASDAPPATVLHDPEGDDDEAYYLQNSSPLRGEEDALASGGGDKNPPSSNVNPPTHLSTPTQTLPPQGGGIVRRSS